MVEIVLISGSMWQAETKDPYLEFQASRKQTDPLIYRT